MPAYKPIDRRFMEKIEVMDNGCHEWQGARVMGGYGHLRAERGSDRTHILAHRYAWERINGRIPDGLMPIHACDNPRCCNVDHLRLGTHKDNMGDMTKRGRNCSPRSNRKIPVEIWPVIRARVAAGEPLQRLGREFQIDRRSIRDVCANELKINPRKLGRPRLARKD